MRATVGAKQGTKQTFYFVRHGEATHNLAKAAHTGPRKWYEQLELLDAPLSTRGLEQARCDPRPTGMPA